MDGTYVPRGVLRQVEHAVAAGPFVRSSYHAQEAYQSLSSSGDCALMD